MKVRFYIGDLKLCRGGRERDYSIKARLTIFKRNSKDLFIIYSMTRKEERIAEGSIANTGGDEHNSL